MLAKSAEFFRVQISAYKRKEKYADILAKNVGRNFKIEKSAEKEVKNVSVFREK